MIVQFESWPIELAYHEARAEAMYSIPLGRADVKRAGTDLTIIATSNMVQKALTAAEVLASARSPSRS